MENTTPTNTRTLLDLNQNDSHSQIGHVPLPPELINACMQRVEGLRLEGFLMGFGKWPGALMLVGEAPGAQEVQQGRPFCGQAGKVLEEYLERLNITRDDLYLTSSVRSRPYKDKPVKGNPERMSRSNRTPTSKEVLAHAPILDREIAAVQPELIITLGNIGLHRLIGKEYNVSSVHGQLMQSAIQHVNETKPELGYHWSEKKYNIFPLYHPAAILYNPALKDIIHQDLKNLKRLIHSS